MRTSCHALLSAEYVPVVAPRAQGRDHRASRKPPVGSGRRWPSSAGHQKGLNGRCSSHRRHHSLGGLSPAVDLSSSSSTRPVIEASKRQANDRRLWHTNAAREANLLYVHLVRPKVPYEARPSGRVPSSIRQDQSAKNRRGPPGQSRLTSSTGSSQDVIHAVTRRASPPSRARRRPLARSGHPCNPLAGDCGHCGSTTASRRPCRRFHQVNCSSAVSKSSKSGPSSLRNRRHQTWSATSSSR